MVCCSHDECLKRATFGTHGGSAVACKTHKTIDMQDVRHPSCVKCHRRPSYALITVHIYSKRATHCHLHKLGGMENVKHQRCTSNQCRLLATYGYIKNKPVRCLQHKEVHMSNVKATVCKKTGCLALKPKYGNSTTGRQFCADHHDPAEHWKLSTCLRCTRIATHSTKASLPFQYCSHHCSTNTLFASLKRCGSCGALRLCDAEARCYLTCHVVTKKSSEQLLQQFLIEKQLSFTHNRCPPNGSSNKRPDFVIATPHGLLILENDENRHNDISAAKEWDRMQELHCAFGQATHFIRFNPDVTTEHRESLTVRHEKLYQVMLPIIEGAQVFFQRHPGLTVHYMYY